MFYSLLSIGIGPKNPYGYCLNFLFVNKLYENIRPEKNRL